MKILVCMDSSVFADEILHQIAGRTWQDSAKFKLVTAVEHSNLWETNQQMARQAEAILEQRVAFLQKRMHDSERVTGEVLEGSAINIIIKEALDWGADLIMIGSHGDTGIRKSGIGSIAAAVVSDAPCSVEVIKLKFANFDRASRPDTTLVHR